MILVKTSVNLF